MSDNEKDLFSKIDALREKRSVGALIEKPASLDDFPVLTEIIGAHLEPEPVTHEPSTEVSVADARPPVQTLISELAPQITATPQTMHAAALPSQPDPVLLETLAHALETRLAHELDDWLARQQAELKDQLRQIIRTEITQALYARPPR